MTNIDLTPILQAVIALAATVITVLVIPWIRSKTTDAQRQELLAWVHIAVTAAEQAIKGSGRGEEKKEYVMQFLQDHGFKVDDAAIDAAIEAAVNGITSSLSGTISTEQKPPDLIEPGGAEVSE